MQASTTLQIAAIMSGLLFSDVAQAQITTPIVLSEPQITSSTDGSVAYEMALRTPLPEGSTAKLASIQIHKAKGFNYPLWLSDAHVEVIQRKGQRQTVRIHALRRSLSDQNEIMLAISNNGTTRFVPYSLQMDTSQSTFEGSPMPMLPIDKEALSNPLEAIANGIVRHADTAPPQIQPKQGNTITNSPNFSARTSTMSKPMPPIKQSMLASTAAQSATATAPDITTPNPTPVATASEPASVASAPTHTASAPIPAAAPSATVALPPPQHAASQLLQGTLVWALGAVTALLMLYLLVRLVMNNRSAKRNRSPVLSRETQFQTSDKGGAANTVFGLSDSEAMALQQQWLQQKMKTLS